MNSNKVDRTRIVKLTDIPNVGKPALKIFDFLELTSQLAPTPLKTMYAKIVCSPRSVRIGRITQIVSGRTSCATGNSDPLITAQRSKHSRIDDVTHLRRNPYGTPL